MCLVCGLPVATDEHSLGEDLHVQSASVLPFIKINESVCFIFIWQVNLNRPCPFWPDDGSCAMKDCSVAACKEVS